MGLRKAGGEMYPWADWTWNPLGGKCPHDCSYCYMKSPPACFSSKYNGEQRIIEQEMKVNLERLSLNRREILPFVGNKPVIFVCSGNDLGIAPLGAKRRILAKCRESKDNFYLFQSKNPAKFEEVIRDFPSNTIIGTTIETNRNGLASIVSNAPEPITRALGMRVLMNFPNKFYRMVSIEPLLDFDLGELIYLIHGIQPDFVSIGADSKKHNLSEPSGNEVLALIDELKEFTSVKKKGNLDRLISNV